MKNFWFHRKLFWNAWDYFQGFSWNSLRNLCQIKLFRWCFYGSFNFIFQWSVLLKYFRGNAPLELEESIAPHKWDLIQKAETVDGWILYKHTILYLNVFKLVSLSFTFNKSRNALIFRIWINSIVFLIMFTYNLKSRLCWILKRLLIEHD